jgi:hypothetical protein|nr:hypothetical protein [Brevundimonas diminuta]
MADVVDLSKYSDSELLKAVEYLNKVEAKAKEDREEIGGPGWDALFAILERDRTALNTEINSR